MKTKNIPQLSESNLELKASFIDALNALGCRVTQPKAKSQFTVIFPDGTYCETVGKEIHGNIRGVYATRRFMYERVINEAARIA